MSDADPKCPLCDEPLDETRLVAASGLLTRFDCRNCGMFQMSRTMSTYGRLRLEWTQAERALLSHVIRRRQRPDSDGPVLEWDDVRTIFQETLPSPMEQVNLLVNLVAERQGSPGGGAEIDTRLDRARLGAVSQNGVAFLLNAALDLGLLSYAIKSGSRHAANLTFKGWERFEELKRTRIESRRAFMAMPFGKPEMEKLYAETLVPGVKRTGFDLVRLDQNPPAGLIDVRLRVELRRSRFLVADLTDGNAGAYWEAGFMEGLGRPVIYLCKESEFREKKTHFDTNHSHHVCWDPERPEVCAEELVNTIRATLPDEAAMEDQAPATSKG